MEYNFREIEKKWQKRWVEMQTYRVSEDADKKKFYVLNMFPYPSGAGLHVGHPLGYIASDIYARYKRLRGYNVLNPMGYDAYGLPAEQYAIQTGQHPAVTTVNNINRYREQLDKIGFSFDWNREVRTCDPEYYHWTQWAFQKMFNSFYLNSRNEDGGLSSRNEDGGLRNENTVIKDETQPQGISQSSILHPHSSKDLNPHSSETSPKDLHPQSTESGSRPISELIAHFEKHGTEGIDVAQGEELTFTAEEWNSWDERKQQEVLMNYRIAYLGETMVNWCPQLGTVLANDEVVDGVSVRGGYPVVQKKMRQWCLRVSAYAQRLLDGLDTVDWTDSLKETQRNWIGRSEGTEMVFKVKNEERRTKNQIARKDEEEKTEDEVSNTKQMDSSLFTLHSSLKEFTIFTTRADTIFGVTFMVLAPESELVDRLTTAEQRAAVDEYIAYVKKRTERERISDHRVTGVFSGSYAINPFTNEEIPIWISEYVLAGYGTGAIMAVPAHDSRDYAFAKHFNLPIIPLIEGADVSEQSFDAKEGIVMNSPRLPRKEEGGLLRNEDGGLRNENTAIKDETQPQGISQSSILNPQSSETLFSLNGLTVKEAIAKTKEYVTTHGLGRVKVNYRLRDAIFSRQRYWGEPFPVYYKDSMPYMIPEECLPLELPEVEKFLPTETGEPPLGHAKKWAWDTEKNCVVENALIDNVKVFPLELNTMPGFAGSSAYYLRYMDPHNGKAIVSEEADGYWQNVDLYVGGTEHATGHLIYSRFWNKFLYDYGVSCKEEPFQKLVNQGMIQGRSNFVYRVNGALSRNEDGCLLRIEDGGLRKENTGIKDETQPQGISQSSILNPQFSKEPPTEGQGSPLFVSAGLKDKYDVTPIHVDVNIVQNDILDTEAFKAWRPEYANAEFILEDGKYVCGWAVEKMSKSMFNVVNPDMIVEKYGADTLRLYEMFLGPVEQSKPWDTNGIDGCHRFLKKFWGLYYDNRSDAFIVDDESPKPESLKSVHKLIKKVTQDIEHFSYNTSISAFMICVNELMQQKCHNRELLKTLVVLIAPFAPHIAEELWEALKGQGSVCDAEWPDWDEKYLVESEMQLTVSFNGKARYQKTFPAGAGNDEVQKAVLEDERSAKYMDGKQIVKVIVVPKKIVNIVMK